MKSLYIWIIEAIRAEKINREKREAEKIRRLEEQRILQEIEERKEEELKQIETLNQLANDWNKADQIRKFVDAAEIRLKELNEEKEREKLMLWIKWAREKADFLDPLTKSKDGVLGEGSWLLDTIERNT